MHMMCFAAPNSDCDYVGAELHVYCAWGGGMVIKDADMGLGYDLDVK